MAKLKWFIFHLRNIGFVFFLYKIRLGWLLWSIIRFTGKLRRYRDISDTFCLCSTQPLSQHSDHLGDWQSYAGVSCHLKSTADIWLTSGAGHVSGLDEWITTFFTVFYYPEVCCVLLCISPSSVTWQTWTISMSSLFFTFPRILCSWITQQMVSSDSLSNRHLIFFRVFSQLDISLLLALHYRDEL